MHNFYILGSVGKKSVQAQEQHQGWGQRLGAYVLTDHCGPASRVGLLFSAPVCILFYLDSVCVFQVGQGKGKQLMRWFMVKAGRCTHMQGVWS